MKLRFSILSAIFTFFFIGMIARSFAAPLDLDGLVAGVKPTNAPTEASVPTNNDEEKDLFKKPEATKEQPSKDDKEKQQLTKSLNYLLIQAYKGKIDKIFGNLQDNIDQYPAEIQIRIFKQVSDSIANKMQLLEEK